MINQELNKNKPQKSFFKKPFFIIFMVFTFLMLIIVLVDKVRNNTTENVNKKINVNKEKVISTPYQGARKELIEGLGGYYYGADNPKIVIVEFSDFACHYCKQAFGVIREITTNYKDQIKYIYRDRPAFTYSLNLSMAAYCAGEQGKFWEMHDRLFQYQSENLGSNNNDLVNLAIRSGVPDKVKFSQCLSGEKYKDKIVKNLMDAQELEVEGTPTFFINGEKITGMPPLETFKQIIEAKLKEK